jgi:hypothetical protein
MTAALVNGLVVGGMDAVKHCCDLVGRAVASDAPIRCGSAGVQHAAGVTRLHTAVTLPLVCMCIVAAPQSGPLQCQLANACYLITRIDVTLHYLLVPLQLYNENATCAEVTCGAGFVVLKNNTSIANLTSNQAVAKCCEVRHTCMHSSSLHRTSLQRWW